MKFDYYSPIACMSVVLVMAHSQTVQALSPNQISNIAKEITVLIDGQNPASGVIIARKGSIYYVLTAKHVVQVPDEYEIVTPDKKRYRLNYNTVTKMPEVDLAVVQFNSDRNYKIARLTDSNEATEGSPVYIAGWPNPGREIKNRIYQFTTGQISGRPKPALRDGYGLVYTNITRAGMSGGPVLDLNGRLIGIHGRAEAEAEEIRINESGLNRSWKIGFNLGIPINIFLKLTRRVGIDLDLQIHNSVEANSPSSSSFTRPEIIRPSNSINTPVCAGRRC
ncbi:MAG: serine protease [Cyanobacteria bacterium J06635_10]